MTLQDLQKELEKIFGKHFMQIAFYLDNREQNNIGKFWCKLETDVDGEYKAWQVRDCDSFEDCYAKIIKKIK
jgi:hypothetical protein